MLDNADTQLFSHVLDYRKSRNAVVPSWSTTLLR